MSAYDILNPSPKVTVDSSATQDMITLSWGDVRLRFNAEQADKLIESIRAARAIVWHRQYERTKHIHIGTP